MMGPTDQGASYRLTSPTAMPKASAFLWNRRMMISLTCRGFATAQFMQPEPAKYAHAPNLEAKTFMQPENPYYAHHPGRFVYVRDDAAGDIYSIPHEPVRRPWEDFAFIAGQSEVSWRLGQPGLTFEWVLSLSEDDLVELWTLKVRNTGTEARALSLYPYFPVGYMSWMNQSGQYHPALAAIICSSVTPYQKVEDYFKNKDFKDKTFLMAQTAPDAFEVRQEAFEGEGGLMHPDALREEHLGCNDARYETPVCAMQYRLTLAPGEERSYRFLFGPAFDEAEVAALRERYFSQDGFTQATDAYRRYVASGRGSLRIETPDAALDNFVNHWLDRQVFYHGDVNRLSTDPQTRNYLQDNMGMVYLQPQKARAAFLKALSQQHRAGEMPDGILLHPGAELKYINQIPHYDQNVWLPVCLSAYLDETGERAILDELLPYGDSGEQATVLAKINQAMAWLEQNVDERGLSYIAQGDWCDPMNMVGYQGKGVSIWLTLASAYAMKLWADICEGHGEPELAAHHRAVAERFNDAANRHGWDGHWYGRGISDNGQAFGVASDEEGRIFLNPQSWAMLSGAASPEQQQSLIAAVTEQLETPYGVAMLAPAYTRMHEHIGRVTQKHPGSAENGSVYNHASAFYVYALYEAGLADKGYTLLRQMLPCDDTALARGQLPVFIPNYYRGAYHQFPRTAGRSSQLFNTGTIHWFYRCLVDGLFGLKGDGDALRVNPKLPAHWQNAKVTRRFRGAELEVEMRREPGVSAITLELDGKTVAGQRLTGLEPGRRYQLRVRLPEASA